jgi:hypothetical protein
MNWNGLLVFATGQTVVAGPHSSNGDGAWETGQ